MKQFSLAKFLLFVIGTELVGALSALITGGFSDFFEIYKAPPLQPPAPVFVVAWVILYALMGISAYLICTADYDKKIKRTALTVYFIQLALNFSWSIVFFRFQMLWTGAFIIALMIVLVGIMIYIFGRIRRISAYLNIPYILWLCFALYLNIATAVINRV